MIFLANSQTYRLWKQICCLTHCYTPTRLCRVKMSKEKKGKKA